MKLLLSTFVTLCIFISFAACSSSNGNRVEKLVEQMNDSLKLSKDEDGGMNLGVSNDTVVWNLYGVADDSTKRNLSEKVVATMFVCGFYMVPCQIGQDLIGAMVEEGYTLKMLGKFSTNNYTQVVSKSVLKETYDYIKTLSKEEKEFYLEVISANAKCPYEYSIPMSLTAIDYKDGNIIFEITIDEALTKFKADSKEEIFRKLATAYMKTKHPASHIVFELKENRKPIIFRYKGSQTGKTEDVRLEFKDYWKVLENPFDIVYDF